MVRYLILLVFLYISLGTGSYAMGVEERKLQMVAEAIDYIFYDNGYQGKVDRQSPSSLLASIPNNQTATIAYAKDALATEIDHKKEEADFAGFANYLVSKLKKNPQRMKDQARVNTLMKLEENLLAIANGKEELVEKPVALPNRNKRKPVPSEQARIRDDVEELKVKIALLSPFKPDYLHVLYAGLFIIQLVFALLLIYQDKKVKRMKRKVYLQDQLISDHAARLRKLEEDQENRMMKEHESNTSKQNLHYM